MAMRNLLMTAITLVSMFGINASGIERDALSIETLRFDAANYDHNDDFGVAISDVSPIAGSGGEWAVVSEIGAGQLSQSSGPSFDRLHLKIGVRHYFSEISSAMVQGGYAWYDANDAFGVGMVGLTARQYLLAPAEPIAPYIRATASLQFVDGSWQSPARTSSSYRMLVIEAFAGCELRMQNNLAFVLEGGVSESESLDRDGRGIADGWLLRIGMQYDWF